MRAPLLYTKIRKREKGFCHGFVSGRKRSQRCPGKAVREGQGPRCHRDKGVSCRPLPVTGRGIKLRERRGLTTKIKTLANACLTSSEGLSSDPQQSHKKARYRDIHPNSSTPGRGRRIPRVPLPSCLPKSAHSSYSKRPCLKQQGGE